MNKYTMVAVILSGMSLGVSCGVLSSLDSRVRTAVHEEIDRTCRQDQWNESHLGDGFSERMEEAKAMWEARK